MKKITIQSYPLPLSRICLGTASMGSQGLTGAPRDAAWEILDGYYAMGGRFLDTANVYGRWGVDRINASEITIGDWLRTRQITDVVITSKACHYAPEAREISRVTKADFDADVESSRRSLGLDKLHLYLLHRDNHAVDIRTIVDFCTAQVDAGHITRFGFSNFTADRVRDAIEYLGDSWTSYFVGVSNEWSMAMDGVPSYEAPDGMVKTDEALREVQDRYHFPIIPFSAAARGFFDKLKKCGAVYDGTWKNIDHFSGRQEWLTNENGASYNRLLSLSGTTGLCVNSLSVSYLLSQNRPVIPIMSVSHVDQMAEWCKLAETDVPDFRNDSINHQ